MNANRSNSQKTKEILKKIRHIEISTRHLVNDLFAGEYESVFKGSGVEFDEVREYQPGDEIRSIDWNVTAKTGKPHVKKFVEERERVLMLLIDVSGSTQFGTNDHSKSEIIAEISALLAFSAIRNNDKVGLICFTDTVEKYITPQKGRKHVLRLIRDILFFDPLKRKTDLQNALDFLNRIQKRRSVVFCISDFEDLLPENNGHKKKFQQTNKRHELITIAIRDSSEIDLPDLGIVEFEDAETGETILFDTKRNEQYHRLRTQKIDQTRQFFRRNQIDHIEIQTDQTYVKPIITFFQNQHR